jgi:SIR2-like protein
LGAGASIDAGVPGVEDMITEFLKQLENEQLEQHSIVKDIVGVLKDWKHGQNKDSKVDIELLLETIEKLENRHLDFIPLFYNDKNSILSRFIGLEKNTRGKILLSDNLKRSIKIQTGKTDIRIDYLKGLLKFIENYTLLDIFSTNYDICIERFCELNNKKYFDGLDGEWNSIKFKDRNKDVRLYKLHGSVTWSRSEKGKYTKNEIAIKDIADDPQRNIVTGSCRRHKLHLSTSSYTPRL